MRFGRPLELAMLNAATKEIAYQIYFYTSLLILTGKFLWQQTKASNYLRFEDPLKIKKGYLETMAVGFLTSQPAQLVVPYLQVAS